MSSSDPASPILFHGPTAQGRASAGAGEWGRVVGVFGDPTRGLDIETVRSAVEAMSSCPVGDRRGSVVLGPVDVLSQEGVIDLLLKTLEEVSVRIPRSYLWAHDVGSVRPTIRSRCLVEWCPGVVVVKRSSMEAARSVVASAMSKSTVGVVEGFAEMKDDWKDSGEDFLRAVAVVCSRGGDPAHLTLWGKVRSLTLAKDVPPMVEVLAGFLP